MLRCVNDINRSIYAFELTDPPEPWVENDTPPASDRSVDPSQSGASGTVPSNTSTEETCTICLEENDVDLKKHCENNCKLVICDPCIEV